MSRFWNKDVNASSAILRVFSHEVSPFGLSTILTGCAFCFLWPYYQRSFYRVTLFHQLGDLSEPCYAVFLTFTILGWAIAAAKCTQFEAVLRSHCPVLAGCALLSPLATIYLAGIVAPGSSIGIGIALAIASACIYAICLLILTAASVVSLMRCVYGSNLFVGVLILVISNLVGRLIAPSSATHVVSTVVMPVLGMLAAGFCIFLAHTIQAASGPTEGDGYQPFRGAPYKGTWLAPLAAYLLLSALHTIIFLNDDTIEMHLSNGAISPAPFSLSSHAMLVAFSLLFVAASVNAMRPNVFSSKKMAFWMAAIGMVIGLFCGAFLMHIANIFDNTAETVSTSDFTGSSLGLSALIQIALLFMVYQNRLSPLAMFGAFFFEPYTLEKLLTYTVLPNMVPDNMLQILSNSSEIASIVLSALTLIVLTMFLLGLCRDNALLMLFSGGESGLTADSGSQAGESRDAQLETCRCIAKTGGLTPRETDILYALSLGHSAKHIGDTLHISERTVQTHSLNIYRKLGVHTRQEVIDLVAETRGGGKVAV